MTDKNPKSIENPKDCKIVEKHKGSLINSKTHF